MYTLNCKGRILSLERPVVMGIMNATPDSFFEGSRITAPGDWARVAEKMIEDGADIIDIGGQSTRPGSVQVNEVEELVRVIKGIETVHRYFPEVIISIDSFYGRVVKEAVEAGASIVNDISAGSLDQTLLPTVGSLGVPYVLMHMRGTPATMQTQTEYGNLTTELLDFFSSKITQLRQHAISDIIIDPGFGFAKTIPQNFELLRNLAAFRMLELPLLIGLSRKATVYKTLEVTADEALNGTTVLNTIGLMQGASILRVHDVREAREAVRLYAAYVG